MEYDVGDVAEGRVTGLVKYGAFVTLDNGKSGLVHISEIAGTYVKEVSEHLTLGQTVKVKIIGIDENNRLNLSIKKALPQEPKPFATARPSYSANRRMTVPNQNDAVPKTPEATFEDKLKAFMADSQSRISDIKHQNDRKSGLSRPRRTR